MRHDTEAWENHGMIIKSCRSSGVQRHVPKPLFNSAKMHTSVYMKYVYIYT